jgi:hypothetical protein
MYPFARQVLVCRHAPIKQGPFVHHGPQIFFGQGKGVLWNSNLDIVAKV